MKRWFWLLLVLVSLAVVIAWPRAKATEEERAAKREEKRLEERAKMWKEDFKACDRYSIRREDARKLLAYDPEAEAKKSFQEQYDDSRRALDNLTQDMQDKARRWEADRRACLRAEGWKNEWIDELEAKDREEESAKATGSRKALPRSTTR